jgi:hypothetical protein
MGMGADLAMLDTTLADEDEPQTDRRQMRVEITPDPPSPIGMSISNWLKLAGYILGLFLVYMQMDSRVHALELALAQVKLDQASFARADVAKVQNDRVLDQLIEVTRRLSIIEMKVDEGKK